MNLTDLHFDVLEIILHKLDIKDVITCYNTNRLLRETVSNIVYKPTIYIRDSVNYNISPELIRATDMQRRKQVAKAIKKGFNQIDFRNNKLLLTILQLKIKKIVCREKTYREIDLCIRQRLCERVDIENEIEYEEIEYPNADPPLMKQNFSVMSFAQIGPGRAVVKLRGVYDTFREAENRVTELRKIDCYTNIYICETGKWLEIP